MSFLALQLAVGYVLVNLVVCIVVNSKWMTCFKPCQSAPNALKGIETTNDSCLSGKKLMLLQHHNARCHTSTAATAVIKSVGIEVILHPLYILDLAPSDFWLLAALRKHLK
jgi:hypothetical protein